MVRKKKGKIKLTGTINDYPRVIVTSHDWISHSEWVSINKAKQYEPSKCFAIGHQFNKTRTKIQLFSTYSQDEDGLEVGSVETIPRSWTITIKRI